MTKMQKLKQIEKTKSQKMQKNNAKMTENIQK